MERGMAETRGITGRRLAAVSWQQFTFALEGLASRRMDAESSMRKTVSKSQRKAKRSSSPRAVVAPALARLDEAAGAVGV